MKAADVRTLVAGDAVHVPGVYDALSARLATLAGFDVLFLSGSAVAAAELALPDLGYVTQTEMSEVAGRVCRAAERAVLVDADTGYGNAISVRRTAQAFAAAGAAGLFLEDQQWPKRADCTRPRIVHAQEWLGKLRAVLDLRDDGIDLFVVARTDAVGARSLEDAVERGKAARDIGADAVFVSGLSERGDLERVAKQLAGVTLVAARGEGGVPGGVPVDELHQLGYRIVVTPAAAVLAAANAVAEAMAVLRRGGPDDDVVAWSAGKQLREAIDVDRFVELDRRYR